MSEQVTIWWVDTHFGMHPATLESAVGTMTAKQVRYKAQGYGNSIIKIQDASFTPQDAIARRRAHVKKELRIAEDRVAEHKRTLARLDEIEKGLDA